MFIPQKVLLLSGPEDDQEIEAIMKFRLTYHGELRAAAHHTDPKAAHKHRIRREFHQQMKELWRTEPFLSTHKVSRADMKSRRVSDGGSHWGDDPEEKRRWDLAIADTYRQNGYRFVPLVRDEASLLCSLDVLFLRHDMPGSVIHEGAIDNRIKTVIDALRKPHNASELAGNEVPAEGEDPFYCLLEDDKQMSHLSVETDRLLDPPTGKNADASLAHLVITVTVRPYYNTLLNLSFA